MLVPLDFEAQVPLKWVPYSFTNRFLKPFEFTYDLQTPVRAVTNQEDEIRLVFFNADLYSPHWT